ncbi:class I glutamine amidotransferase-like protein [Boletus reticuloceps]|uniref:Class I glutamine amidotransferase-like protein n=1 Tax=Boletus reticuloceps TaxID=495285 RepID=A0A8I3A7I1_9AGAM|nr:class I glutamine amidotransferase-like protein [Boletus reticuloceps]
MSTIRLALLICDDLIPPLKTIHGNYTTIYHHLLSSSLARITSDVTFTLDGYDVVKDMAYPPDSARYDGLLISGSRVSAYEDVEWINKLIAYVKRIITEKPSLKLFGICFGHQIVARALGESCVRNPSGWEVAVTTIQLTPLGKAIFGSDQLDIQQSHLDHVPTCPPNAHLLGSTDVTPNHGMVIFDPASVPILADLDSDTPSLNVPLTSIHVLTVQGHPEFTESIMTALLDVRVGLLGEKLVKEARLRAGGIPGRRYPGGLACDGVGRVGKVIWDVLGVV